jgi:hypothetical protein
MLRVEDSTTQRRERENLRQKLNGRIKLQQK